MLMSCVGLLAFLLQVLIKSDAVMLLTLKWKQEDDIKDGGKSNILT